MENDPLDLVSIANELEAFIQSTIPDAVTISKYGGTLFTLKPEEKEGQFCGVFIYSKHVQLSFSNGPKLTDENKILKGSGKYRRHVNFDSADQINYAYLKELICQAAEF